jgi:hypothetical protein
MWVASAFAYCVITGPPGWAEQKKIKNPISQFVSEINHLLIEFFDFFKIIFRKSQPATKSAVSPSHRPLIRIRTGPGGVVVSWLSDVVFIYVINIKICTGKNRTSF